LKVKGMGEAAIASLKTVRAAALLMSRQDLSERPVMANWQSLLDYCRANLAEEKIEQFHLLFLDGRNALIAHERQQTGTVNHAPVYPREIMRRALELSASAIILVHNHPSGDPQPSTDDINLTHQIIAVGKPLKVAVHDHLIIGKHGHASLKGLRLI
jgi:DNA repair protein RadC